MALCLVRVLLLLQLPVCVTAADPVLPAVPSLSPDDAVKRMTIPAGMKLTCFAAEPDVMQPVGFSFDDRGRLWVAEAFNYPKWAATGSDRVIILEDTDGDGKADKRTVFYDKFNYITGIECGFGGVFVTSPPCLYFIPDRNGDDQPDSPPIVLLDGFGYQQSAHNIVNGATYGPDGWLYGGHGGTSFSLLGKPDTPEKERIRFDGGVWRYHPVRHIFEPFCEGFTNPWGIDFDEHGQAFVSNCVLPHLYHIIQGGHYDRRKESTIHQHVYKRLGTIADHLHYVGGNWQKSAGGAAEQLAAGGGHAHAGCMIYQGDTLPQEYRGRIFMINLHGARINMDVLQRKGSGFTASHGRDLVTANDSWFRGVTLQQGPDGSIYFSDWHDTGECHSMKPDRSNGRIFRLISAAAPPQGSLNVAKFADDELVKLQASSNEWMARRARRLLQERSAAKPNPAVHVALTAMLRQQAVASGRLRALWALHVTGGLTEKLLDEQLQSTEEYVRGWAVQLAAESGPLPRERLQTLERMAKADGSAVVRLYLAAACQRLPIEDRWEILAALAAHAEDADDSNLPPMIWYALEAGVLTDRSKALMLATAGKMPALRQWVARRIAETAR